MKRLVCYLFLLLWAQPLFATSIVIIIGPGYVLMGTDSRRLFLNDRMQTTSTQTVCKIRRVNNHCFALAGFVAAQATSFSADSIVAQALRTAASPDAAARQVGTQIKQALQTELRVQKTKHSATYQQLLAAKEHLLEVAILSVYKGRPQVLIMGFQLSDPETVTVGSYTSSCPGDCPPQPMQVYFMGEYSGMEKQLRAPGAATDPTLLVEQLIVHQSRITPSSVSAPINLVRFTSKGMEWIR